MQNCTRQSKEVEARLEEWITDKGSGLDLDMITAHDITISQILVTQAIGRYIHMTEYKLPVLIA